MARALALAERAVGLSEPNPRVGCVLTDATGRRIGEGHTQAAGGPHAEVMALRDAAAHGGSVRGATAWVTLEPCAHHGRTPPCCDALVAAGVARVVVALEDPNPLVNGQGLARLRAAGVQVELLDDAQRSVALALNIGFVHRMRHGRPWVRLKVAASLDGRTALPDGQSQWITSPEARTDGHAWRRRAGALLTGIGTLLSDNPQMDVRLVPTDRQPLRVVVDARLDTPADARIWQGRAPVLLACADPDASRIAALSPKAGELLHLPAPGQPGKVDLPALLAALAQRGVNELHLEAGGRLNGAWLAAGLVDELLVYQAPCLIGPGQPLAELPGLGRLVDASRWHFVEASPVGPDLRLRLQRPERTAG